MFNIMENTNKQQSINDLIVESAKSAIKRYQHAMSSVEPSPQTAARVMGDLMSAEFEHRMQLINMQSLQKGEQK